MGERETAFENLSPTWWGSTGEAGVGVKHWLLTSFYRLYFGREARSQRRLSPPLPACGRTPPLNGGETLTGAPPRGQRRWPDSPLNGGETLTGLAGGCVVPAAAFPAVAVAGD